MSVITTRNTRVTVLPVGEPIFSEMATHISIEDEGTGEYIRLTQFNGMTEKGEVNINPEEWLTLRGAINTMVSSCRKEDA